MCGDSLRDEQAKRAEGSRLQKLLFLSLGAVAATGTFVVVPGWILILVYPEWDPVVVIAAYVVAWIGALALDHRYRPKDVYQTAWNPMSYRNDLDRAHIILGFALVPVQIVRGLWVEVWHIARDGVDQG